MRLSDTPIDYQPAGIQPEITVSEPCTRCSKLEAKLDTLEEERRELAAENRKLWKENGELREKCARLEERQERSDAAPFDEKHKTLPFSKQQERP